MKDQEPVIRENQVDLPGFSVFELFDQLSEYYLVVKDGAISFIGDDGIYYELPASTTATAYNPEIGLL